MVFVVSTKGISHRYLYIPHTVPCGGRSMTNIVVSKMKVIVVSPIINHSHGDYDLKNSILRPRVWSCSLVKHIWIFVSCCFHGLLMLDKLCHRCRHNSPSQHCKVVK